MAEHYTQGRQGQGARRRRHNNKNQNRHHRQRMPRMEETTVQKPSLLQRVLSFLGFGKKRKSNKIEKRAKKAGARQSNTAPQKVRIAKLNGNSPAAPTKKRKRATSTPPTQNARLYVGNLSYEATESDLEDLFKGFGNVRSVEVIYNPRTYKSKGYAFVEMHELNDAKRAAEVLHGHPFMGRELMVSAASEKPETSQNHAVESKTATAPSTETVSSAEEKETGEVHPPSTEETKPQG